MASTERFTHGLRGHHGVGLICILFLYALFYAFRFFMHFYNLLIKMNTLIQGFSNFCKLGPPQSWLGVVGAPPARGPPPPPSTTPRLLLRRRNTMNMHLLWGGQICGVKLVEIGKGTQRTGRHTCLIKAEFAEPFTEERTMWQTVHLPWCEKPGWKKKSHFDWWEKEINKAGSRKAVSPHLILLSALHYFPWVCCSPLIQHSAQIIN